MEPTLFDGDICLVDAWSILWERCALDEVVVSKSMRTDRSICKRLLGVQGDRVRYIDPVSGAEKETAVSVAILTRSHQKLRWVISD